LNFSRKENCSEHNLVEVFPMNKILTASYLVKDFRKELPMRYLTGILVLTSIFAVPKVSNAGGGDFRVPTTAAARELSNQLAFLQTAMAAIPGGPQGRGLWQQCDSVQGDLQFFQQQLKSQVSQEELFLNFDKMDAKLNQLMTDIKGFEKWDDAMRMVGKRVVAAGHDLQFALSIGDGTPARGGQATYRQTLSLLARSETFANMVRYVFNEQAVLQQWNAELASLHQAIKDFQGSQQNKAAAADVKTKFLATDQAWEKLVVRLKALPQGQYILLQSDGAQVDQVLSRLAPLVGVKDRRAPLTDPLAF
jgi:hypothetical protein